MAEEMASTLISPRKLADAVFNSIPPIAAETCDGCISKVNEHLQHFGYEVTKVSLKHLPKTRPTSSDHGQFRSGIQSIQKLYCSRCTTHDAPTWNNNGHVFQCSVVAEVKYYKEKNKMKVVKLFPHPKECLVDEKKKTKWIMAQCNNGIGWTKLKMNYSSVVGEVFDVIFQAINNLTKSNLGAGNSAYGKRIVSDLFNPLVSDLFNPPDMRFYFKTSDHDKKDRWQQKIIETYDLNNHSFQEALGLLHIRLMLFLANYLDIASELPFEVTNYPKNHNPIGHNTPTSSPHLSLGGECIIFGGYMNDEYQKKNKVVHQIPHNDIGEQVNGGDDLPYSVSNNPDLRDKFKPGSIIIPEDSREIFIFNGNAGSRRMTTVKVEKDEMIVFEGDLIHSETSYLAPSDMQLKLYPSIQYFLASAHHKRDLEVFDISTDTILNVEEFQDYVSAIEDNQIEREFVMKIEDLRNTVTKVIDAGNQPTIVSMVTKMDELSEALAAWKLKAEPFLPPDVEQTTTRSNKRNRG